MWRHNYKIIVDFYWNLAQFFTIQTQLRYASSTWLMKVLFMIRSNVIAYHQKEDDQQNALEGLDLWITKHLLTYITLILLQYKFPRIFSYCSLWIILKILGHASYFTTIKYICKYSMFLSFFYCKTYRGTLNTEEIGCKSCVWHKPPVKLKTWED